MDLAFDKSLVKNYKSESQKIRVMSEDWVSRQGYCPKCGQQPLNEFKNNAPVADFYCSICAEQYELKSKKAKMSNIINDGAYDSMIERINSKDNPNFFFLTYDKQDLSVNNFLIIPKHFFTCNIIVKRNPLKPTAKRAAWVGCNIDLRKVPDSGKVFLIHNQQSISRQDVVAKFQKTTFLKRQSLESRGWILDVMRCVDRLPERFTLIDIYSFENHFKLLYPENNHIKDKLRQQLQLLRDKGFIEFLGNGHYRKLDLVT